MSIEWSAFNSPEPEQPPKRREQAAPAEVPSAKPIPTREAPDIERIVHPEHIPDEDTWRKMLRHEAEMSRRRAAEQSGNLTTPPPDLPPTPPTPEG